jgi:hypothetical protein
MSKKMMVDCWKLECKLFEEMEVGIEAEMTTMRDVFVNMFTLKLV